MDIIEEGFHVEHLIVNFFNLFIMSYIIKVLCVMRIILLLEYDYVIRIHIMLLGFHVIPNYIASCDYECCILWDIE
jgi:hypothetical protein